VGKNLQLLDANLVVELRFVRHSTAASKED
jgi:hypothetical protein